MTLSEIRQIINGDDFRKIISKEQVDSLINGIIDGFKNGDQSLNTYNRYIECGYNEEHSKYMAANDLEKSIVRLFREIFILKPNFCDIETLKKIINFCTENNFDQNDLIRDYIRIIINYSEEEIRNILTTLVNIPNISRYNNNSYGLLIHFLKGRNRLNLDLLKFILETTKVYRFDTEYFDITQYSEEERALLFSCDYNLISGMPDEMISDEMIEVIKSENCRYSLDERTPQKLLDDRELVKLLIKRNPNGIKYFPNFMEDEELLNLAVDSGLQITDDLFNRYNIISLDYVMSKFEHEKSLTSRNGIVVTRLVMPGERTPESVSIYKILNECAKKNMYNQELIDLINESDVFSFYETETNELVDFLANKEYVMKLIKKMDSRILSNVTFEPDEEFITAFYENGNALTDEATPQLLNSKELYTRAFQYSSTIIGMTIKYGKDEFLTLDLLKIALSKGLNPITWDVQEISDNLLKDEVHDLLLMMIDPTYKQIIKRIISKAGCTVFYMQKDNILAPEVIKIFGEELVTKIIRNLIIPGESLDFKPLIENQKVEEFYNFYLKYHNTDDIRQLKFLFDVYNDNQELIRDILDNGMTEKEEKAFKEYIFQKGKLFKISHRKFLDDIAQDCYNTNEDFITRLDNYDVIDQESILKTIIFGSLFNVTYDEVESLIGIIGLSKIDSLIRNVDDYEDIEMLQNYKVVMEILEGTFNSHDIESLKAIARFCNQYYNYPSVLNFYRSLTKDMVDSSKELYTRELNSHLSKVTDMGYIVFDEDSYFLAHVMNAFGNGSTLSDFKNPRFIGKTYICLTAIGKNSEPYRREEVDKDHVTLLFDHIKPHSLISMSNRDMYSRGGMGDLDVLVSNNFYPLGEMLDRTGHVPNEYVVYRETAEGEFIYPSAVLVVGNLPSEAEKQAAEELGVPLVKRAKIDKQNNMSNASIPKADSDVMMGEEIHAFGVDRIKELLSILNSKRPEDEVENVLA